MGDVPLYYEVTPPSKRSTRWELEHVARSALEAGAQGLDITDSPTGESHSSSVAASVYARVALGAHVVCHIRTRDVTPMGLRSLVRACSVWDVGSILFVMGEGGESSGLTPTEALGLVRREHIVDDTQVKLGLVVDPRRPVNLERKLSVKPDFIYSAPITSLTEAHFVEHVASTGGCDLYAGVFVNTPNNRPILDRIGVHLKGGGPVDWDLLDTLKTLATVIVVMSPADPSSGVTVLRELKRRVA